MTDLKKALKLIEEGLKDWELKHLYISDNIDDADFSDYDWLAEKCENNKFLSKLKKLIDEKIDPKLIEDFEKSHSSDSGGFVPYWEHINELFEQDL